MLKLVEDEPCKDLDVKGVTSYLYDSLQMALLEPLGIKPPMLLALMQARLSALRVMHDVQAGAIHAFHLPI